MLGRFNKRGESLEYFQNLCAEYKRDVNNAWGDLRNSFKKRAEFLYELNQVIIWANSDETRKPLNSCIGELLGLAKDVFGVDGASILGETVNDGLVLNGPKLADYLTNEENTHEKVLEVIAKEYVRLYKNDAEALKNVLLSSENKKEIFRKELFALYREHAAFSISPEVLKLICVEQDLSDEQVSIMLDDILKSLIFNQTAVNSSVIELVCVKHKVAFFAKLQEGENASKIRNPELLKRLVLDEQIDMQLAIKLMPQFLNAFAKAADVGVFNQFLNSRNKEALSLEDTKNLSPEATRVMILNAETAVHKDVFGKFVKENFYNRDVMLKALALPDRAKRIRDEIAKMTRTLITLDQERITTLSKDSREKEMEYFINLARYGVTVDAGIITSILDDRISKGELQSTTFQKELIDLANDKTVPKVVRVEVVIRLVTAGIYNGISLETLFDNRNVLPNAGYKEVVRNLLRNGIVEKAVLLMLEPRFEALTDAEKEEVFNTPAHTTQQPRAGIFSLFSTTPVQPKSIAEVLYEKKAELSEFLLKKLLEELIKSKDVDKILELIKRLSKEKRKVAILYLENSEVNPLDFISSKTNYRLCVELQLRGVYNSDDLTDKEKKLFTLLDEEDLEARKEALISLLLHGSVEDIEKAFENLYPSKKWCADVLGKNHSTNVVCEGKPRAVVENILITLMHLDRRDALKAVIKHCGNDLDLNVKSDDKYLLELVIKSGDAELLEECLRNERLDIEVTQRLAGNKNRHIAFLLIEKIVTDKDLNPKMITCLESVLHNTNFDKNSKDENGDSILLALYYASNKNAALKPVFNAFFESLEKAQKENLNSKNQNIAHIAAQEGDATLLTKLAANSEGRNCIRASDKNGTTPYMLALFSGDKEAADAIKKVERHDSIKQNNEGVNLLMAACDGGNIEIIKEFLDAENLSGKDKRGECALHHVQTPEALTELLAHRVDQANKVAYFGINDRNNEGSTPLMKAVAAGNYKLVRALIEAGADVNMPSHDGMTPLMLASVNMDVATVAALLKTPLIDVNVKHPKLGLTAFEMVHLINKSGKLNSTNEVKDGKLVKRKEPKSYEENKEAVSAIEHMLLDNNADKSILSQTATTVEKIKLFMMFHGVIIKAAARHSVSSVTNLLLVGTKDNPLYTMSDTFNKFALMEDARAPMKKIVEEMLKDTISNAVNYKYVTKDKLVAGDFKIERNFFGFKKVTENVMKKKEEVDSNATKDKGVELQENLGRKVENEADQQVDSIDELKFREFLNSVPADVPDELKEGQAKSHHKVLLSRYVELKKILDSSYFVSGGKAHLEKIKKMDDELLVKCNMITRDEGAELRAIYDLINSRKRSALIVDMLENPDDYKDLNAVLSGVRNCKIIVRAEDYYKVVKFEEELEAYKKKVLESKFLGFVYRIKHAIVCYFENLFYKSHLDEMKRTECYSLKNRIANEDGKAEDEASINLEASYSRYALRLASLILGHNNVDETTNFFAKKGAAAGAYIASRTAAVALASRAANIPAVAQVMVGALALPYLQPFVLPGVGIAALYAGNESGVFTRMKNFCVKNFFGSADVKPASKYQLPNVSEESKDHLSAIKAILATGLKMEPELAALGGNVPAYKPRPSSATLAKSSTSFFGSAAPIILTVGVTVLLAMLAINDLKKSIGK